jgi:hypothetical protein
VALQGKLGIDVDSTDWHLYHLLKKIFKKEWRYALASSSRDNRASGDRSSTNDHLDPATELLSAEPGGDLAERPRVETRLGADDRLSCASTV